MSSQERLLAMITKFYSGFARFAQFELEEFDESIALEVGVHDLSRL